MFVNDHSVLFRNKKLSKDTCFGQFQVENGTTPRTNSSVLIGMDHKYDYTEKVRRVPRVDKQGEHEFLHSHFVSNVKLGRAIITTLFVPTSICAGPATYPCRFKTNLPLRS